MTEQVGTNTQFNMSVDEIIELALEGIGGEHTSHSEAKLARTSLNLVFIDLQNEGMAPLASLKLTEIDLVSGSSENYTLSAGVFNILDGIVEVSTCGKTTDLGIERMGYTEWLDIPTKGATKARPTRFLVNRQRDAVQLNFWPVPDAGNYKFKAWTLNRIADVDASHQLVDLPHRYLPAIMKGLRFYMSDLRGSTIEEKSWMKNEYKESLQLALSEDRERISLHIYPNNRK